MDKIDRLDEAGLKALVALMKESDWDCLNPVKRTIRFEKLPDNFDQKNMPVSWVHEVGRMTQIIYA